MHHTIFALTFLIGFSAATAHAMVPGMTPFVKQMFAPQGLLQRVAEHKDPWGRDYPVQCSPQALADLHMKAVPVTQRFLDKATDADGRYGVYMPTGAAGILEGLADDMWNGVLDHEKCHAIMKKLTGSPEWHK